MHIEYLVNTKWHNNVESKYVNIKYVTVKNL